MTDLATTAFVCIAVLAIVWAAWTAGEFHGMRQYADELDRLRELVETARRLSPAPALADEDHAGVRQFHAGGR